MVEQNSSFPVDKLSQISLQGNHNNSLSKSNYVNATVASSTSNFSSAGTLANLSTCSAKIFDILSPAPGQTNTTVEQELSAEILKWNKPADADSPIDTTTTMGMSIPSPSDEPSENASIQSYSFLQDKYGGHEGYRKRRNERLSYYPKLQKYPDLDTSPGFKFTKASNSAMASPKFPIKLEQVQERVFPAIDLHFYNCLYTHEYKTGPIYEDCLYDDDEMKLSSFVDHGVMFDPSTKKDHRSKNTKKPGTWFKRGTLHRTRSNPYLDDAVHTTIYKERIRDSMSHSADNLSLQPSSEYHEWPLTRKQEEVAQSAGFQHSLYVNTEEQEKFLEQEEKCRLELYEHMEQTVMGQQQGTTIGEKRNHRNFFKRLFRK